MCSWLLGRGRRSATMHIPPHMNPMGFRGGPPMPMMFRGGPPMVPFGMQQSPIYPVQRGGFPSNFLFFISFYLF